MKTYNNFNEMFNAQSSLKSDLSVFNEVVSGDGVGEYLITYDGVPVVCCRSTADWVFLKLLDNNSGDEKYTMDTDIDTDNKMSDVHYVDLHYKSQ